LEHTDAHKILLEHAKRQETETAESTDNPLLVIDDLVKPDDHTEGHTVIRRDALILGDIKVIEYLPDTAMFDLAIGHSETEVSGPKIYSAPIILCESDSSEAILEKVLTRPEVPRLSRYFVTVPGDDTYLIDIRAGTFMKATFSPYFSTEYARLLPAMGARADSFKERIDAILQEAGSPFNSDR
jgi:hypothetical protein